MKNRRKNLLYLAQERLGILPQNLIEGIKRLESPEILDDLFRRTLRCDSLEQFKGRIAEALES